MRTMGALSVVVMTAAPCDRSIRSLESRTIVLSCCERTYPTRRANVKQKEKDRSIIYFMATRTTPAGTSAARERLVARGIRPLLPRGHPRRRRRPHHRRGGRHPRHVLPPLPGQGGPRRGVPRRRGRQHPGRVRPGARGRPTIPSELARARDRGPRRRRRAPAHPRLPVHQRGGRVPRARQRGARRRRGAPRLVPRRRSRRCSPPPDTPTRRSRPASSCCSATPRWSAATSTGGSACGPRSSTPHPHRRTSRGPDASAARDRR